MRAIFTLIIVLFLAPFMVLGVFVELARFGLSCGMDVGEKLLTFALKTKGGAK